jgi:hypothetical protein
MRTPLWPEILGSSLFVSTRLSTMNRYNEVRTALQENDDAPT